MIVSLKTLSLFGMRVEPVTVEVFVSQGLPRFKVVGLANTAVQESAERVRAALQSGGFEFPRVRITVSLAPADMRKDGTAFDLIIALGVLAAFKKQLDPAKLNNTLCIGELSLDGKLRGVRGALAYVRKAKDTGFTHCIIAEQNAAEVSLVQGMQILPAQNITQVVAHFRGENTIKPITMPLEACEPHSIVCDVDFSDIKGQRQIKRALEICAAGGHNVLLNGPPGAGKTLLGKAFAGILPPLSYEESLEVQTLYSLSGKQHSTILPLSQRPFRSVHHNTSGSALLGGGSHPRPGELTLAHKGVLFLDEIAEFPSHVLNMLRQPLEERIVHVSRTHGFVSFPADVILCAAMNPCPCGYVGSESGKECTCTPYHIVQYQKKLSGPLLDRIDLFCRVDRVPVDDLEKNDSEETSESVRAKVIQARQIQHKRFTEHGFELNSHMGSKHVRTFCQLDAATQHILRNASERLCLSARGYFRTLKIARTIADLAKRENILCEDIAEALQYRMGD